MEDSPQAIKERMSPQEWNTIYKMSQDKALYQNLITSLFPTIHGNEEVRPSGVDPTYGRDLQRCKILPRIK
jgi:DNA replication licensing factor MCM6